MTNRKLLSPSPLKDKYAHTNFFRSSKDAKIGRYTIGLSSTAKKRKNKKKAKREKIIKFISSYTISSTSETQTRAHNTLFSRQRRNMRPTGQNNIGRNLSSRKKENKRKPKNKSENLELIRSYCAPSHSKLKHTQTKSLAYRNPHYEADKLIQKRPTTIKPKKNKKETKKVEKKMLQGKN